VPISWPFGPKYFVKIATFLAVVWLPLALAVPVSGSEWFIYSGEDPFSNGECNTLSYSPEWYSDTSFIDELGLPANLMSMSWGTFPYFCPESGFAYISGATELLPVDQDGVISEYLAARSNELSQNSRCEEGADLREPHERSTVPPSLFGATYTHQVCHYSNDFLVRRFTDIQTLRFGNADFWQLFFELTFAPYELSNQRVLELVRQNYANLMAGELQLDFERMGILGALPELAANLQHLSPSMTTDAELDPAVSALYEFATYLFQTALLADLQGNNQNLLDQRYHEHMAGWEGGWEPALGQVAIERRNQHLLVLVAALEEKLQSADSNENYYGNLFTLGNYKQALGRDREARAHFMEIVSAACVPGQKINLCSEARSRLRGM